LKNHLCTAKQASKASPDLHCMQVQDKETLYHSLVAAVFFQCYVSLAQL
jgi:hypothetical protein